MPIECLKRYEPLAQLDYSNEAVSSSSNNDKQNVSVYVDVDLVGLVGSKSKRLVGNKRERKLRVARWNFSGLSSDRNQKEVGELLAKHNLDVVAGQESWEMEETRIEVEGYKCLGSLVARKIVLEGKEGLAF